LFAVGSVAFTVNAVSFYSMTAHLVCNGLFALCLMQRTPLGALLAGCAGGLALTLHNPVPHMLFAAPWVVWTAGQKDRLRQMGAMAAGYLPWILVVGFGWHALLQSLVETVSLTRAGTGGIADSAISTIKGVLSLPGRTQLQDRAIGFAKLWLWAAPMLVVMAIYGAWLWRRATLARLLVLSAILTLLGYMFVPLSQGHGWGFRYFHSAWLVLPILAGAAMCRPGGTQKVPASASLGTYSLAAALVGLVCITPFALWQVRTFVDAHLAQLPEAPAGTPRLLIVNPANGYYSQDLVQNDPLLRNDVIRMVTQGGRADEEMMRREFPQYVMIGKSYQGTVWGNPARPGNAPAAVGDVAP
jgi:hypothetical protein